MKVNLNSKLHSSKQPVFNGFVLEKDKNGINYYNWSYPFDANRYKCFLDVYPVMPDENGDYDNNTFNKKYTSIKDGSNSIELKPKNNRIYLDYLFGRVENAPFAYHYRFVPIDDPDAPPIIGFDSGDLVDKRDYDKNWDGVYNIVVPNSLNSGNAGAAILISADNFDVRYMYDKEGNIVANPDAEKGFNTFVNYANHVGGSLAGVHKALQDGRLDLYDKIFLLPHTSGDRTSAAGYWLESGFQFSSTVDNIDTFTKFQNELFAKGKNLIADSALTSEGLSGIHIQSILKHGEDDVFAGWFKCNSLKNMTAKICAFGVKTEDIRHKLINPPEIPIQNSNGHVDFKPVKSTYKANEPIIVQVYSAKAASPEQITDSTSIIEKYGNPNGDGTNPLHYGNHNDISVAYNIPINFKTYKDNVRHFNEYNAQRHKKGLPFVPLNSYMATRLLTKFEKFEFENKIEGGFYTWDANVDIPKFNYALSNEDVEEAMNIPVQDRPAYFDKLEQKRCEVLDYAVSSLSYWTRKTNQSLNLYVAQKLKKVDATNPDKTYSDMTELIEKGVLPRKIYDNIDEIVVKNVLNNRYKLHGTDSVENIHNTILDGLMKYPLESTEVGKDILALFSTPYITNRATNRDDIGKSRFELLKQGDTHLTAQYEDIYNRTTNMYTQEMYKFAQEILEDINRELPKDCKLNKGADTSDYGKYVIPIVTQEIAKYAVVKGLFPDVKTKINEESGGIIYDYEALRKKSLKSLDIDDSSQKTEAKELVKKLTSGIRHISDSDKKQIRNAVYKMIENTNLKSFQMAEMIVDRTKSGMSWRIDALKDFSNMDGLRNGLDSFENNWNQVIYITDKFSNAIRKENPNAYIVPEVTDEVDLYKLGDGENSKRFTWEKYQKEDKTWYRKNDIIKKLLREGGVDTVANYAFYFTNVAGIYGKRGEDGGSWGPNQYYRMYQVLSNDKTNEYADDFLYSGPYNSIIKSYSFVDNHDKPRINHVLSFDMGFGFANLNDDSTDLAKEYRKRAYAVLNPDKDPEDYYSVKNYDFSYVNAMAMARGEALNDSFSRALNELSNEKDNKGNFIIDPNKKEAMLYEFKSVVAQMASGKYNKTNYEAYNFGVEEVHKVLRLVIDEFASNNNISNDLKTILFDTTFKMALDPALNNSLGMDKFLVNLPGIPTIYAGDDLGSTGWERKTKNETKKVRSAVRHDWLDKYEFIQKRKTQKDAVYMLRSRPALHALNDGAPFLLKKQYINDNGDYLTALLRYANDGSAVISLFNPSGITHEYNKYTDPYNNRVSLNGNKINLTYEGLEGFIGLHSGLTENMKFVNAFDKNDVYYVYKGAGDEYYLAKNRECSEPITLTDNVLTLYHADENLMKKEDEFWQRVNKIRKHNQENKNNKMSFCGKQLYANKQYNVIPPKYNKY